MCLVLSVLWSLHTSPPDSEAQLDYDKSQVWKVWAGTRSCTSWSLCCPRRCPAPRATPDAQAPLGLSHLVWKMWLQGSLLAPVTISSRQIMQTLSIACSSSGVASGYLVRTGQGHVKTRAGGGAPGAELGQAAGTGPLTVCSCCG